MDGYRTHPEASLAHPTEAQVLRGSDVESAQLE